MDQIKIGKYIAAKRKQAALTQIQLAEKMGMSNKSVSKWERGICLPDVSKYQELCSILGISLNELFAGEDLDDRDVVCQSEANILGVAKLGKQKSKRLLKIIICLLTCTVILAASLLWAVNKENPPRGNYVTAFSVDNPKEAETLSLFGGATVYEYSLDESYKKIEITIVRYDFGKETTRVKDEFDLPEERGDKGLIGIQPELSLGVFNFIFAAEWGAITSEISVERTAEESYFGHAIEEIQEYKEIKKAEPIAVYAYQASGKSLSIRSIQYIAKTPEKALKETPLCYLITFSFK